MRGLWIVLGLCTVFASLPSPADAQQRACRQVLPSDARRILNRGQEIIYYRDPVRVLCEGGLELQADSAVMNRGVGSIELVGNVFYQDSIRELRSDWAHYLGDQGQLLTRGSTVLTDRQDGAVITGEHLNYLRENETRPEARMIITGDRPYARIPPRSDTAPAAGAGEAPGAPGADGPEEAGPRPADGDTTLTEVWADRMELIGESLFLARGDVDLRRGELDGEGDEARFNQASGRMTLIGTAHVRTPDYRLDGDRIEAAMVAGELEDVLSRGSARLTAEDLAVRAERIGIGFANGELERLEAWNPDPAAAPFRARADSREFRMRADSIDVRADSAGLQELRAVGRAYGERATAPADPVTPVSGPADPTSRDWIQGDTILGYFARVAEAATEADDSARTVLDRLVVVGTSSPALSLYQMRPEEGGERPAINFMKASRIILYMERGEVARVEAEGPIEGLYLEPDDEARPAQEPASRSAATDGRRP